MPALTAVKAKVDGWLTGNLVVLDAKENAYYGAKGPYWQGLWSHAVLPSHANAINGDIPPDKLSDNPTDQVESWVEFWPALVGVGMTAAVRVDVYAGPTGDGFVVTAAFKFEGDIYLKARNDGPEIYRERDWFIYELGDEPHPFLN